MEHNNTEHNPVVNFILTLITGGLGFISVNYQEKLKDVDLLLSPMVKVCSLLSFLLFLIINWDTIKKKFKNIKKLI